MRCRFSLFLLFLLSYTFCSGQYLYRIPKQTIDPFQILGPKSTEFGYFSKTAPKSMKLDMDAFEISTQITYGQYKEYLKAIKKDSSASFYLSQMPDTTMCLPENYKAYTSGNTYDDFPVVGISWNAAMNYCRWITATNNKGSIEFICRLPCESEWLAAYNYLETSSTKNDFNQNYSDWLLNTLDEAAYNSINSENNIYWNNFDYIYLSSKNVPNVLKRKRVIGDSYLFKMENLADYMEIPYYQDQGYRQIGFRVIKEPVDTVNLINKFGKPQPSMDIVLLKSWGLK